MMRLAVLGSTRGTNLSALAEAVKRRKLHAEIDLVISNKPDAVILERAREHRLRAQFIDPADLSREAYDARVSTVLREHQIDLLVLIGYMRILSASFVNDWQEKIINVHPSLLPAFAGKMDLDVHAAVLAAGVAETGCTVHYVTAAVDAGPILLQKRCAVLRGDTPESLKERVQQLEGVALVEAIELLAARSKGCK
jgi:phosphoribosylglycinamide formyltransferase-1